MSLIVKSKVKEIVKEIAGEFNVAEKFGDALDAKARILVSDAIKRAQANGRKTLMPRDL